MHALLLVALLCAPPAGDDPLLSDLQAEFDALAADDRFAADLRQAEQLLRETDQSSRWTNYSQATAILRRIRSKAAVPLLLQYMVRHAELSTSHVTLKEYAHTISYLTGEKIENPHGAGPNRPAEVRKTVEKLYREWWLPGKAKLLTDAREMTAEQLEVVIEELIKKSGFDREYPSDPSGNSATAYQVYHLLFYHVMNRSRSSEQRWDPGTLTANMVPSLLARAGYREADAADAPPVHRVPYAVVSLLAELRKNQEVPQLDRIAASPEQPSAARLTSILAMYAAGEKLDTDSLLSVLEHEKRLELRLVAIIALYHSNEPERVVPRLMALLDDRNGEIQTAAVCALRGPKPPEAVPRLAKMIDELSPAPAMTFVFDVIGEIGTFEAKQVLADFMRVGLDDDVRKKKYVSEALGAFATANGRSFYEAGAHNQAYYHQKAREALVWWAGEQARSTAFAPPNFERQVKEFDSTDNGHIDFRRTTYLHDSQPMLICTARLASDGRPKQVASTIYYAGKKVYVEISGAGDPVAFATRSFPETGAAVGMYGAANQQSLLVGLVDPAGRLIALFDRESDGALKPLAPEQFAKIAEQHAAVLREAEAMEREPAGEQ